MGATAKVMLTGPSRATRHELSPPANASPDQPLLDPDTRPHVIPPALWSRLVRRRDRLELQGAVVSDSEAGRRPRYRLRFRCWESRIDGAGCTTSRYRQRSIELGNEATARTVERLLAVWRDDRVCNARMQRLCAASQAVAEREERRRLEAQVDAAHDEAIDEDAERTQLATLAPDDNSDEVEVDDTAPVPQLPSPLVPVRSYLPLTWRAAKRFLIDCVEAPPDPDEERHKQNVRVLAEHHEEIATAHIPNELLDKLLSLKDVLVEYGAILKRREADRRPSYRLRVRAPHPDYARTHRSIRLRDDEVEWVGLLLSAWRAPREAAERRRRKAEQRLAHERREMCRFLTEFRVMSRVMSRDQPELMAEVIDMASILRRMIRGEAPYTLVPLRSGHALDTRSRT